MFTIWISGTQIQKVRNKTVKEFILSEWQSRYSRNLWSSSFAHKMYEYMDVNLNVGNNQIFFQYKIVDNDENIDKEGIDENDGNNRNQNIDNVFTDKFVISNIITSLNPATHEPIELKNLLTVRFFPYKMSCEWWEKNSDNSINTWSMEHELIIITKVNDNQYYCFEINHKNCRLVEIDCEKTLSTNWRDNNFK